MVTAHRPVSPPVIVRKTIDVSAIEIPNEDAPAEAAVIPPRIILVLDDDPASRKLLKRRLGREGYEVREASDASGAVSAMDGVRVDLAIVNCSVREEGEKAVRALRSVDPELMVLVLSEMPASAETSEKLLILPTPSRVLAVVESVRDLMSQDRPLSSSARTTAAVRGSLGAFSE
jgi:DNA-binding NtrC family response regulator